MIVDPKNLLNAVRVTIPFMPKTEFTGTDRLMIHATPGRLRFTATDRYTIGAATVQAEECESEDFRGGISREHAKTFMKVITPRGGPVTLTLTDDVICVDQDHLRFTFVNDVHPELQALVERYLRDCRVRDASQVAPMVAVRSEYLRRMPRTTDPIQVNAAGDRDPVYMTIGENGENWFEAVVMPVIMPAQDVAA